MLIPHILKRLGRPLGLVGFEHQAFQKIDEYGSADKKSTVRVISAEQSGTAISTKIPSRASNREKISFKD